jgi:hypothetical protein
MPRFQRRLKARRFSFGVQQFNASSEKPRRVQRRANRRLGAKPKMAAKLAVRDTAAQQGSKIRGTNA